MAQLLNGSMLVLYSKCHIGLFVYVAVPLFYCRIFKNSPWWLFLSCLCCLSYAVCCRYIAAYCRFIAGLLPVLFICCYFKGLRFCLISTPNPRQRGTFS